jgi:exosortase/archaeosortase family protein
MPAVVVVHEPLLRRPEVRFPVRFVLIAVAFVAAWVVLDPPLLWLQNLTAAVVAWLSSLVGLHAATEPGAGIAFGDGAFRYTVSEGCTAGVVVGTYAAAVLAYPASRRNWLLGLAIGIPVLLVVNLVRLVTLGWFGLHARSMFDAVHIYWWQIFYVVGTGALWFGWAWWTSDARSALAKRRTVSRSSTATTAAVVVLQLLAFAVLGLWAHGAELYSRTLRVPYDIAVRWLWNGRVAVASPGDQFTAGITYGINYALLAAVIALFLASPGLDLRTRLRGVVRWAIPSVMALQLAKALWSTAFQADPAAEGATGLWDPTHGGAHLLTVVLHIGLSLVVWHSWLQRESRVLGGKTGIGKRIGKKKRRLRAMDRRREHGQAKNR